MKWLNLLLVALLFFSCQSAEEPAAPATNTPTPTMTPTPYLQELKVVASCGNLEYEYEYRVYDKISCVQSPINTEFEVNDLINSDEFFYFKIYDTTYPYETTLTAKV